MEKSSSTYSRIIRVYGPYEGNEGTEVDSYPLARTPMLERQLQFDDLGVHRGT